MPVPSVGRVLGPVVVITGLSLAAAAPALAEAITVVVAGIETDGGEIGCALYGGPEGFPMDDSLATVQWQDARRDGVVCSFVGLVPGAYAVAVSHDFNGNQRTDTNFFGIPTEPWGVTNNVRPMLRAPSFEEAAVELSPGTALRVTVEVAE